MTPVYPVKGIPVEITNGGLLHEIHGATAAMVYFLHGQGNDLSVESLQVETVAPDGLIGAIRAEDSPGLRPGVQ